MTKSEQRLKAFSSGMKNLSKNSRNYIHKLTHVLLLVKEPPVCPVADGEWVEKKKKK